MHERVGILDLTGFAKYDISGPDAEAFLNRVCANRIPRKVGGIALVHMLSAQGRILGEMTVTPPRPKSASTRSPRPPRSCAIGTGCRRAVRAGRARARSTTSPSSAACSCCRARDRASCSRQLTDASLGNERSSRWLTGARDPRGRARGAGAARELRRRARVGAASADRLAGRAVRGAVGARPRVRHRELRPVCGQQHAHREGLQGLVDRAHQRTEHARGGHGALLRLPTRPISSARRRRSRRRRARSRSSTPRSMRPTPMRAAASRCWRRRPLHRRDHVGRLRAPREQEPRLRLRRAGLRGAGQHASTC